MGVASISTKPSDDLRPIRIGVSAFVLGSVVFLLEVLYWALYIRREYFPAGDDFSLIVHSTHLFHPSPAEWLHRGFSNYFYPYPDISVAYTNFLRPVDNAVYYIESLIFFRHWSFYLLGSYLIVAALVATTYYIARASLRLGAIVAGLVALATVVSPAFSHQVVFQPSFGFDYLGGLCALLTLALLLRGQLWFAWLCVCVAVFSKESAYYSSAAACLVVFVTSRTFALRQRLSRSAAFLLPIVAVAVLRRVDFPGLGGVYALNDASSLSPIKRFILGLTHWPYTLPGEQHVFDLTVSNIASLLVSLMVWLLLLWIAASAIRSLRSGERLGSNTAEESRIAILIFLLGSLVLAIPLNLTSRFGASTFPLFFLSMGGAFSAARSLRSLRLAFIAVIVLATGTGFVSLEQQLFGPPLHQEQLKWARSRALVQHLSHDHSPVVFLVADAIETYSSPDSLQQFASYVGQIVPVSNLGVGCSSGTLQVQRLSPQAYFIRSTVAANCGSNTFAGAAWPQKVSGNRFQRDLPQATIGYYSHDGPWLRSKFSSQDLEVHLYPKVSQFEILMPPSQNSISIADFANPESTGSPEAR